MVSRMRNQILPDIAPAAPIFHDGRRHTFDLDTVDCELAAAALKLMLHTRDAGKLIGTNTEDTPAADARELALLRLFETALVTEGAHSTRGT